VLVTLDIHLQGTERFISGSENDGKNVHFDFENQNIVCGLEYHFYGDLARRGPQRLKGFL
jgi:hypothetical protein